MSDLSERIAHLSPKRLALLALELDERVESLERSRREPIAIIGMACRFPGGGSSPEDFWRVLRDGVDAIREVPGDRWDIESLYHPDPDAPGRMSSRWGGFIDGWDLFDPHFFGISPREAQGMDPQQRVFLEVAWEALERAGQSPDRLHGSATGVFAGVCNSDYGQLLMRCDLAGLDAYFASGNAFSVLTGRLSYILGLQGPAVSVDTACSSSLVAVHLACQSLRLGECRMAITGGVNYIGAPEVTIALSKAHMMAPDGRCKAFDAAADGFVRGEGCGLVVLKRLSDAEADGDTVLAVIRGSATNQDGRSSGLTAPNGPSQEAVIAAALGNANLSALDVDYVEAHGTGTSLGDPIEARALGGAYGAGRTSTNPLAVGSVKTNIGHLESAAGIAGIMKVVLALQHEELPAQLHFRQPSPYIDWDRLPISVLTEPRRWRRSGRPRIAGVSSFGFSGTNAHVLIEEPPIAAAADCSERPVYVLPVSARTTGALKQLAGRYADCLDTSGAPALADVCSTASSGRSHFAQRIAIVAASRDSASRDLRAWAAGHSVPAVQVGESSPPPPDVAFVFTGQGSQYLGMGRELYASQPVFARALDACDTVLREYLPSSLKQIVFGEGSQGALDDTRFTQPALFAIEYALAEMWRSWGIQPSAVMGHSVGEFVAACVSGALDLEGALRLIAARGRLMSALPAGGRMAAVFAPAARVEAALGPHRDRVSIAAVNGPETVVISGAGDRVEELCVRFAAEGVKTQALVVSHAFHSPLMRPMLDEFAREASEISFAAPRVAYVSNLTGTMLGPGEIPGAEYWCRHVMAPVQFAVSVRTLFDAGYRVFLEVGPTPTLLGMARRAVDGEAAWVPSLRKGKNDWSQLAESLGALYVRGVPVDWEAVHSPRRGRRVTLPTYPFQRQRFWALDTVAPRTTGATTPARGNVIHPLLGTRVDAPGVAFEALFDVSAMPVLRDHRIGDTFVVPGPVYVEMAAAAAGHVLGDASLALENLAIRDALVLEAGSPRRVHTTVTIETNRASIEIHSSDPASGGWILHARVSVSARAERGSAAERPAVVRGRCPEEIDGPTFLRSFQERGIDVAAGSAIETIWRRDGEALALLVFADDGDPGRREYRMHPAVLDAATLVVGAAAPEAERPPENVTSVLAGIDLVQLVRPAGTRIWVHAIVDRADQHGAVARLELLDEDGTAAALLDGLRIVHLPADRAAGAAEARTFEDWVYDIVWRPVGAVSRMAGETRAASPLEIARELEPGVEGLWREHGFDRYASLLPALERLCGAFAERALLQLGVPGSGTIGTASSMLRRVGVAERHQGLFGRLLDMLVEDGVLARSGDEYSWVARGDADPESLANELIASYPAFAPQVALTRECGRQLAAVVRGTVDPLHLLFPGGSFAATEHLYEHSPSARIYNTLVSRAIARLAVGWPANRPIRCLEIGAGTGGTTSAILPALPASCTEYHYTDLSKLFMSRAADKFRAFPFVRYGLLDIEQNPLAQGYEPGTFDLVIAANVVHATADLRQTMENVQRLLASGGVLMLVEGTDRQRWVDLTFGLLEGWWKFSDSDLRPTYPLLSRDRWSSFLYEAGFSDVAFLPARRDAPQAIILARSEAASVVRGRNATRRIVVLGDAAPGSELVRSLSSIGREVVLCESSDGLARHLRDAGGAGCDIVHIGALDVADGDALSGAVESCADIPAAVSAVAGAGGGARLWIVTAGAQAVNAAPRPLTPARACVWGLGRVLALEHPDIWGGLVDLDPAGGASQGEALAAALDGSGGEDQIAIRDGLMYVPRLVRAPALSSSEARLNADGAYLVTGAFGGLGMKVARWLAERGARCLVLTSRGATDPRSADVKSEGPVGAADAIREIERLGATVHVVAADVADRGQMRDLFARFGGSLPPLRGIVHAAVQMSARPIRELDATALREMFRAKVLGSAILDELSRAQPLDFLVMFSSTTALWGVAGLGHYAAANTFMDALAHERRRTGQPALSVNWGTWDEMRVASAADQAAFAQGGLLAMDSAKALHILANLLDGPAPQRVVASVDWTVLKPVYEARRPRPLFREVAAPSRRTAAQVPTRGIADELREAPRAERREKLIAYVRQEVASVLGLPPGEPVPLAQGLFEMGMDSLMSVELKSRLERGLSHPLPSTLTFNYPNVGALAAFIEAEVLGGAPVFDAQPPAAVDAITGSIGGDEDRDELTEDELAGLLAERLNRLGR